VLNPENNQMDSHRQKVMETDREAGQQADRQVRCFTVGQQVVQSGVSGHKGVTGHDKTFIAGLEELELG